MKVGDVVMDNEDLKVFTGQGLTTITGIGAGNTVMSGVGISNSTISAIRVDPEDILDKYILNQIVVEHKVTEHEMLKIQETSPDYAEHIKENLTKNAARDIVKKMSFTKKKDVDADVTCFRGRVWVFTKEELLQILEEAKNG
jgi:hypothetical protein